MSSLILSQPKPRWGAEFFSRLADPLACTDLFDALENITFFVKDRQRRYLAVNRTLAERVGAATKEEMLGKTVADWFPSALSASFEKLDREVLATGRPVADRLRLHFTSNRQLGWCLLRRLPLVDQDGEIIGLAGLARDLHPANASGEDYESVATVVEYIRENIAKPLRVPELAKLAGLSTWQLDQRIRRIFNLSAGQFVIRTRLDHARHLLADTNRAIAEIAIVCGYADQSAFTRQFRQATGVTPRVYRKEHS